MPSCPFSRQRIHVPRAHFGHVVHLFIRYGLDLVLLAETKRRVDCVAAADEEAGAEDDEEDDDGFGEGEACVVALEEWCHLE